LKPQGVVVAHIPDGSLAPDETAVQVPAERFGRPQVSQTPLQAVSQQIPREQ
jgi:hypothetical protein